MALAPTQARDFFGRAHGTELVTDSSNRTAGMCIVTFLSRLRFTTDQNPEPGDAVVAHVLDIGAGRPQMKLATCDEHGDWSCAETGVALAPRGSRSVVMGWVPNDDAQEQKYRERFGL